MSLVLNNSDDEYLQSFFAENSVKNVSYNKKDGTVSIFVTGDRYYSEAYLAYVSEQIKGRFNIDSVVTKYIVETEESLQDLLAENLDSIISSVEFNMPSCIGFLHNSKWLINGNKLIIYLNNKTAKLLCLRKCDVLIHDIVLDSFSYNITVEFSEAKAPTNGVLVSEGSHAHMNRLPKDIEISEDITPHLTTMSGITEMSAVPSVRPKAENKKPEARKIIAISSSRPQNARIADPEKKKIRDVFIGRSITQEIQPISEVTADSYIVAVKGKIIALEERELKNGTFLVSVSITDFTSSIKAKFFVKAEHIEYVRGELKVGKGAIIQGEAQYDKYERETTIKGTSMAFYEVKKRMDAAENKRVELHMHTTMSMYDGVSPVEALIENAAAWGHKAIAITDHGVVQAFDDAAQFIKKKKLDIKPIYGVECYLIDEPHIVLDNYELDMNLDAMDYVVFDLETTGLDNKLEHIIEIGAVKMHDGKIIDKFSSYVDPETHISPESTKIHGITDDMIAGAPKLAEALPRFLAFAEGCILVAHNAAFDVGFIAKGCEKLGIKFEKVPVLDTCELARRLLTTGMKSYRLNDLCEHYEISLVNHHRAVDDCMACAELMLKLLAELDKNKHFTQRTGLARVLNLPLNTKTQSYHCIILVQNKVGLKNLYRLITDSHLNYYFKTPRIPRRLLSLYREGLIIGSACEAGDLFRAILDGAPDEKLLKIADFYDYLEIQPLGNNNFLIRDGKAADKNELIRFNTKILELADKLNKPTVATCDVHFMNPEDEIYRRVIMAGKGFSDADEQAPLFFRTTDEMLCEFEYLGDRAYEVVVENTNKIADMIEGGIVPIPSGMHPPTLENSDTELRELCMTRAHAIYGDVLPEIVSSRLEKELDGIISNGYSVMYMIAQKLVFNSQSNGHKVDSRGSVGSSFAATMSGITEVNPLVPHYVCPKCKHSEFFEDSICNGVHYSSGFDLPDAFCPICGEKFIKDGHNIPFETFLGFEGNMKIPDIDLNFSGEYQGIAMKYVETLFGAQNVFRAGTIGTIADKTAFGYVANYYKEREIEASMAEMNRIVAGCTGIKRTTGQHPGGIIVVPREYDVHEFTPLQHPADDSDSNIITTHFAFSSLHDTILKLDILGHTCPSMLRALTQMTKLNLDDVPNCDPDVVKLFTSVEPLGVTSEEIFSKTGTLGLPENGTDFVRGMLDEAQPKTFSDLLQIMGLSHGTNVWLGNGQSLIHDGICTISSVIACRDDIMTYLVSKGIVATQAFTIMESVRKGRGLKPEWETLMKENDVPDWYIDSCKKIKYMFPKAHAVAYTLSALRLGWFKIHYPKEFYAVSYTISGNDFDVDYMIDGRSKLVARMQKIKDMGKEATNKERDQYSLYELVNEMYCRGIKILGPDIHKSKATEFTVEDDGIRAPLTVLPNMGALAAQDIVNARESGGEFKTVEEISARAPKAGKTILETLKKYKVTGDLPDSSQMNLFELF